MVFQASVPISDLGSNSRMAGPEDPIWPHPDHQELSHILTPLRLPEHRKPNPLELPEIAPCLLCEQEFLLEAGGQQELLKHLLQEHRIVIGELS